jgi:hypothetical protein
VLRLPNLLIILILKPHNKDVQIKRFDLVESRDTKLHVWAPYERMGGRDHPLEQKEDGSEGLLVRTTSRGKCFRGLLR